MSFVMSGVFQKYGGWQLNIIQTCQRFYEKYKKYPNYIRMTDKTMDALFEENEKAFLDPYSEEHAVYDSKGEFLLPLKVDDENNSYTKPQQLTEKDGTLLEGYVENHIPSEDEEEWKSFSDEYFENDSDDTIYPLEFGINDDCTVSFLTNKFELFFLEGNGLPDDYYIVQFGDGPHDGGEDDDEIETEVPSGTLRFVA